MQDCLNFAIIKLLIVSIRAEDEDAFAIKLSLDNPYLPLSFFYVLPVGTMKFAFTCSNSLYSDLIFFPLWITVLTMEGFLPSHRNSFHLIARCLYSFSGNSTGLFSNPDFTAAKAISRALFPSIPVTRGSLFSLIHFTKCLSSLR